MLIPGLPVTTFPGRAAPRPEGSPVSVPLIWPEVWLVTGRLVCGDAGLGLRTGPPLASGGAGVTGLPGNGKPQPGRLCVLALTLL